MFQLLVRLSRPQESPGGSPAAAAAARVDRQRAVEVGEEDLERRANAARKKARCGKAGPGGIVSSSIHMYIYIYIFKRDMLSIKLSGIH